MSAVDDVKARLDIVDVVGAYVRLQKAGRYFKGLCPFHSEKTPSFVVYPERQSWHCFGACATGGDVISFIARKENLDFGGSLRLLADRAGVELKDDGPRRETVKSLQDANEAAALYFHGLLLNHSTQARAARAYAEERGLDSDAISDFQIGYAPPGWDNLQRHLTSRGFDEAKLVEAGLLIESDASRAAGRANAYDRFRDRLMFPIRDDRGRVVGFGGRVLPGERVDGTENGPKYMNTPQTPIFDKGSILYGLHRAKDDMRQSSSAVIVEGYMDVIAAHQHGFRNVVAAMGTALTDRQATLLQRFANRVVLAMDADEAGSAANLRGVQVVAAATERPARAGEAGPGRGGSRRLDIRVLALPQGKDPDELIRADPEGWRAAIEAAKPVAEHHIAVAAAGRDLSLPQERADFVAEVLPTIAEESDPVLQAHYIQRLSRLGRVSEESLRRQLPHRTRPSARRGRASAGAEAESGEQPQVTRRALRNSLEEFCLALLQRDPQLREAGLRLNNGLFTLSENRELFERWRHGQPIAEEETLWEHYQEIVTTRTPQVDMGQGQAAFLSCVARLEKARIKAAKEASVLALAEGETGVRPGQVAAIALERLVAGEPEPAGEDSTPESALSTLLLRDARLNRLLHGFGAETEIGPDQTENGYRR
jgi:DNA primase